jgi:dihydropyrimidinase
MADYDLIVRNARIVTAERQTEGDIAVRDGQVVEIGPDIKGEGAREIDAGGKFVLPGGVDSHCHIEQKSGMGVMCADDFYTGTVSAAFGGTTTIIPFAAQHRGMSLRQVVNEYHEAATPKAVIDYAFHLIVTDPTPQALGQELPALIKDGYTSFKIYMTYDDLKLDDAQILTCLEVAREQGAMAMIHAENADAIAFLTKRLTQQGKTAPRFHGMSRPMPVEREATHRAITLSELVDVPILIVHVSGGEAVDQIRWARGKGLNIFAETCPQYLFLTQEHLGLDGFHGAKCVCSPPPRDAANQQVIWDGLADGLFTIVSSDHAPFKYDDPQGKKLGGEEPSFEYIPNGIPGLETRLPLLFSEGVMGGRLSLQQFVALTATNPARLYGLYPKKGTIAIGADADLVIWDTSTKRTITNSMLHHEVDYTPYEGIEVGAWPATTLSRGRVVWDGTNYLGTAGGGEFLKCGRPEAAKPRTRDGGWRAWTGI